jgi:hypothetical protein
VPAVLAPAVARAGDVYGGSGKDAAMPVDHPVSPERLAATIYHGPAIDPGLRRDVPQGRPVAIGKRAETVLGLFG